MKSPKAELPVYRFLNLEHELSRDWLVSEEPLEIGVSWGPLEHRKYQSVAVTMRTPGDDIHLTTGFLFTEGLIQGREELLQVRHMGQLLQESEQEQIVLAELHPAKVVDLQKLSRHFYTTSSCGVCGKASLELVRQQCSFELSTPKPFLPLELLYQLPEILKSHQSVFHTTGGLHAAALFDAEGNLLYCAEDVGRHNAVDKMIGWAVMEDLLPLDHHVVLVSGRAGFELVQKCTMAGVAVMAAVGAPTTLSVELANEQGMTLIGFLRDQRFNVYCGTERLIVPQNA